MSEITIKITTRKGNFGTDEGTNIYTVSASGKTVGDFTRYNQTEEDIHELIDELLAGGKIIWT